jgi:hypothetical protein
VGSFEIFGYVVTPQRVKSVSLDGEVLKDVEGRFRCSDGESANLGAVAWVEGSKKLLLVAEVPPVGVCDAPGMLFGYIVSFPAGHIVQRMTEKQLRSRWGAVLGTRFAKKEEPARGCAPTLQVPRTDGPGEWSLVGKLAGGPSKHNAEVLSASGRWRVVYDGANLRVKDAQTGQVVLEREFRLCAAEVLWATESDAFVVTASNGSVMGEWGVFGYVVTPGPAHSFLFGEAVEEDMKGKFACGGPGPPNIGAIAWLDGPKRLILVAEVPRDAMCKDSGRLFGYVVTFPEGRILERLTEKDLRTTWGSSLGIRFAHTNGPGGHE